MGRPPEEKTAELMAQVATMRVAGLSFRMIAAQLGISTAYAHKLATGALAAVVTPAGLELRDVEEERLDLLWRKALTAVNAGDVQAISVALRISESRRKMWGVDAPAKTEATVTVEDTADAALREMLQHAEAENQRVQAEVSGDGND